MQYKIVTDSSSNVFEFSGVPYACVPMKIRTDEKEYVDTPDMDVAGMVEDLLAYAGTTRSSCPNIQEWVDAFEGADCIFAVTITSNLSGSYNAAMNARTQFLEDHPNAKVCVIDSLSAGPELELVIELIRDRILAGDTFEEIEAAARKYLKRTHLLFTLKSLNNLARNGRVNPAVAKIAGVLGISLLGKASDEGTLEPLHKCRGERSLLKSLFAEFQKMGYKGGKVRISHCLNLPLAQKVAELLREQYPLCDIKINACSALCSFYAEKGGFLIAIEDG